MTRSIVKQKSQALTYERRLTLFIDFLGFKEHVQRTVDEPDFLQKLLSAMDRVKLIAHDDAAFYKSQKITQFSDCIVLSYLVEEKSAVFWLLNDIAFCVTDLVERGFLLRGALTVGDLLHTDDHVVGPALIEAHQLESKVAKFPRIIIGEKVLDIAGAAPKEGHTKEEESAYVKAFMTVDTDGRYYFDYVSWHSLVAITGGDNDIYPTYLQNLESLIQAGLQHTDTCVLEKYLWLHRQYVAEIEKIVQLPESDPYRLQNPEIFADIASLPRLTSIASAAQQNIDAMLALKLKCSQKSN